MKSPLVNEAYEIFKNGDSDDAILYIQERLGVTTGDNAGVFFSGREEAEMKTLSKKEIIEIFTDYITFEEESKL